MRFAAWQRVSINPKSFSLISVSAVFPTPQHDVEHVKGLRYWKRQQAKQVKQAKLPHPASLIVQPNAVSLRHACTAGPPTVMRR
jgi:hypothetical protein